MRSIAFEWRVHWTGTTSYVSSEVKCKTSYVVKKRSVTKTSYVSNSGDIKEQTIVSLGGKNIIHVCNFRGQMQNLICSKKKLQETHKNNQLAS